jgi:hypothetical protein
MNTKQKAIFLIGLWLAFFAFIFLVIQPQKAFACTYGSDPCNSTIPTGTHETTSYITGSTLYLNGSVLGHYVCGSNYYYGYGIYKMDGTKITQGTSGCTGNNPYAVGLPSDTGDIYVQLWDANCSVGGCPNTQGYYLTYNHTGSVYSITGLAPVDGVCGVDNGQTTNAEPPIIPHVLCIVGTQSAVAFDGYQWTWTCTGSNGGATASCVSYNTNPVNATCGSDNGQTIGSVSNFCGVGALIYPTFVNTLTGWTWTCAGINGGENSYCSATNSGAGSYPTIPTLQDCSGLSIPNSWICEINNAVQSALLPSQAKLNELQKTLNKINGRFPFNFISAAETSFTNIKNSLLTGSTTLAFTLLGHTGNIETSGNTFISTIKIFSSFLFLLGFLFWGVGYIKHFFK